MSVVIEQYKKEVELKCDACSSRVVYTLKDGTIVCRRCGHRKEVIPKYVN